MKFLKTTVVGGLLFLVPVGIIGLILVKAHTVMAKLAAPLARWIPVDAVGGIALANLLAVLAIVVICFAAGLLARSRLAVRLVESLESGLLYSIPGYAFIKGMTGSLGGEEEQELTPVLARFDDAWQVAFRVEDLPDERVVLYVPGSPDPWSGALFVMAGDRVEPLDLSMSAVVRSLRAVGRGSRELLSRTRV